MEPPTGTLPWVQSSPPPMFHSAGIEAAGEGLQQSAHKTRRILSLTQILDLSFAWCKSKGPRCLGSVGTKANI